jgi:hypothetical protein
MKSAVVHGNNAFGKFFIRSTSLVRIAPIFIEQLRPKTKLFAEIQ